MEAVNGKKEVDEMKVLAKEIGIVGINKLGPVHTILPGGSEGWEFTISGPNNNVVVHRAYFDLAGMSMQEKTLFFQGATVQETLLPSLAPATAGSGCIVVDVMSNHPITNDQANAILTNGNIGVSPGATGLTFDQTVFMQHRIYNIDLDNQAGGYAIPLTNNQLGSLSPSASDRLYITRIVGVGTADGDYTIYPCRYVISADAKEEPEYEYLMRLKRSYELQQRFDRD
jgi:hypothetical protein